MCSIRVLSSLLVFAFICATISCKKEHSCEGCNGNGSPILTGRDSTHNQPPVAIAYWDSLNNQPPGNKFVTAKYSTDTDGTIVSYQWKQLTGPIAGTIINPRGPETIISHLVLGNYSFELTVTDNSGLTAKDTVFVKVSAEPVNSLIQAHAGPDQTITLPLDSTYLDGSGSSPNGFTASSTTIFRWTTVAGPTQYVLNPPPIPVPALTKTTAVANGLVPGVYLFAFTVTEIGVGSATDTVQVTVLDDPQNTNTVTYHNLVWEEGDPYAVTDLTTFISSPLRPDLFHVAFFRGMQVFLKLNAVSPWTTLPYKSNVPFSWNAIPYTLFIATYPTSPSLRGTKSDMRIKIL